MDKIGYETASIILILLPGFISAGVISALSVRPKQTDLERVIQAALNTFTVVVVYAVAVGKFPVKMEAVADQNTTQYQLVIERLPFLALVAIAVVWSLLVCFCEQHDFPFRLLRSWRFTTRTARSSLWDDAFSTYGPQKYVQVELADGRSVMGYSANSHALKILPLTPVRSRFWREILPKVLIPIDRGGGTSSEAALPGPSPYRLGRRRHRRRLKRRRRFDRRERLWR